MTAIRTWVCGIVAWGALATSATAAPLSWFGSQASLTAWYANQLNSAGNIYAPASNTVSNVPTSWYAPAESATPAVAALGVTDVSPRAVPASTVSPTVATFQVAAASQSSQAPETNRADAFVDFGPGPYADASTLTVGSPSPWYGSEAVTKAFGDAAPNADQRADFVQTVMANVERTFELSGVPVTLTDDPQASAPHTMSVVSGASYGGNPNAIGITTIGGNGFSFIDKLGYASNPDDLAWAVAHNVSHELMHALGVANHPDESGDYLDAAVADWGMLTDPDARFSPSAIALMQSATSGATVDGLGLAVLADPDHDHDHEGLGVAGAQFVATPVPEPSTIAVWTFSGLLAGFSIRRRFAGR